MATPEKWLKGDWFQQHKKTNKKSIQLQGRTYHGMASRYDRKTMGRPYSVRSSDPAKKTALDT